MGLEYGWRYARRDGPENVRILKWISWGVVIGPVRRELGLLSLRHVVKFCRSLPTEILNTTRYAARWGWDELSKNCVFLFVSKNRSQKLINCSHLKRQSRLVFAYVYVKYTTADTPTLWIFSSDYTHTHTHTHTYIYIYI